MKRYIKVNGSWIDTLLEQKEGGRYYFIIEGKVSYYSDESGVDTELGELEGEKDSLC